MKIRKKVSGLVFIPTVISLLLCFLIIFIQEYFTNKKQIFNHVESVSEAKSRRINGMIQASYSLINIPSRNEVVSDVLEKFQKNPRYPVQRQLRPILVKYSEIITPFDRIHILSKSGKVIASSDSTFLNNDYSRNEGFAKSVKGGNYFDGFHFDKYGDLKMYLSSPVLINKKIIGVVLVEHSTEEVLSITDDYTGLGETGETTLGKIYGDTILYLVPLRFDKNAALKRFLTKKDTGAAMYKAVHGLTGIFESSDYRGTKVISSVRYIKESEWGIVTKIDYREAMAPVEKSGVVILIFFVLSFFTTMGVAWYAGKYISEPLRKFIISTNEITAGDFSRRIEVNVENEIGQLAGSFNTMTEKLQSRFSELESFSSAVIDTSLHGIIVFKSVRDQDGQIIDFEYLLFNKAAERILRQKKDCLIGKRWLDNYPGLKDLGLFEIQKNVVETGISTYHEFFYDQQNFNKWFKNGITKFGDGLIVTFDDITPEKEAVEKLKESEILLKEAQSLSKVGYFVWYAREDKVFWSDEMYKIYRYEPGELEINADLLYSLIHPEDLPDLLKLAEKNIFNNPRDFDYTYRFRRKDNSFGDGIGIVKVYLNEEGKIEKVFGVVNDVTSLKEAERELIRAKVQLENYSVELEKQVAQRTFELSQRNEELKSINIELDKFAYIVSHDLKAPLNSFIGLLTLLKGFRSKPLDEEGEQLLQLMEEKADGMSKLIENILKSSRKQKTGKDLVNLFDLTKEVTGILNPPRHFHLFIQHSLPEVKFNRTSLMQVFQNLIGNAIKFMDKEQPIIKITAAENNDHFVICIEDNGMGIAEDRLETIFDAFAVAHEKKGIESYGIGLSVVKKLIEENGGRIWAESQLNSGTKFQFTIPR
jgi:PAS domain S-box-containing protein